VVNQHSFHYDKLRTLWVFCFNHFGDIELFYTPTPVVGVIFPDHLLKGVANACIENLSVDSRCWVLAIGIWDVPAYLDMGIHCQILWD
jgi:hypothetical protein